MVRTVLMSYLFEGGVDALSYSQQLEGQLLEVNSVAVQFLAVGDDDVQPISVQPISAQPMSVQPMSVQPMSVQPMSVQPMSVQPMGVASAAGLAAKKSRRRPSSIKSTSEFRRGARSGGACDRGCGERKFWQASHTCVASSGFDGCDSSPLLA